MKLTEIIKEKQFRLAWWLEIVSAKPYCIYYFGPFSSAKKAQQVQAGYIEDLAQEGAQGIDVQIKRCQPIDLTISTDVAGNSHTELSQSLKQPTTLKS